MKDQFYQFIRKLQDTITSEIEAFEPELKFHEDLWDREEGGGGRTRVLEGGEVIEKGGVNISAVHGKLSPAMQNYFEVGDVDFFACGLSLVLHPRNPFVPTVHANWRYFEMYEKDGTTVDAWFGGGLDLTPYFIFEQDIRHFHQTCKDACDRHDPDFYQKYKKRCDDYFWNAHRNEARGVGGLFFDYLKASKKISIDQWYDFVTDTAQQFLPAFIPILEKRHKMDYGPKEREWQEIRRGRYVEFNLIHDKGTLFGLKTNGRIESIFMSLPPQVKWKYDYHPAIESREAELIKVLKSPQNWV